MDALADSIILVGPDGSSPQDLSSGLDLWHAPDVGVTDSTGTPTSDLIPPRFDVWPSFDLAASDSDDSGSLRLDVLPSFDVVRRDTIPLDVVSDGDIDSGGLGRADVALTCVQQIKNNNYSWGAFACSQCVENSTSMEAACKSMIECLANKSWPCSGTCWTDCSNSIAADAFVSACASTLTNAACPHD
jgi:hypothetical protein